MRIPFFLKLLSSSPMPPVLKFICRIGLGISPDGQMVGSDAFVVLPDSGSSQIEEYTLDGTDSASDQHTILPSILSNTEVTVANGYTVARFTRAMDAAGPKRKASDDWI